MNGQDCAELEQLDSEQREKLVKITARIGSEVNEVIRDLASEFGVSAAQIVRLSIDGHLEKYLGTMRYIDTEQGEEIKKCICKASNEMQEIKNQIRMIGINVNQLAKYMNIEKKIDDFMHEMFFTEDRKKQKALNDKVQHYVNMKSKLRLNKISAEDMDKIMEKYEAVTKELGDTLWHIQG